MMGKQKIGPDTVVVQVDKLIASDLDGETVMMSVQNGKYYGLDRIGSRIWALMDTPLCVSELCDILIEEYQVEPDDCRQDVLDLLNELEKHSLVKVFDGPIP